MTEETKKIDDGTVQGDELDLAMAEAKNAEGGYTHKFKKPFRYGKDEFSVLHFDFEGLTGNDMINIEKELAITDGVSVVIPSMSTAFLLAMAAKAAGLGSDAIKAMPIFEVNAIRTKARNFLLSAEL